jgi:prepilin-type N-terminal cleavage/methylation domain-containing protein
MIKLKNYIFSKTLLSRAAADNNGFSLAELIVALAIVTIAISAMVKLFSSLSNNYTVQNVAADVQQTGRTGLDYMAESIRLAGLDPFRKADAGIEEAISNKLRFTFDRCDVAIGNDGCGEPNGEIKDKFEKVTFLYDDNEKILKECLYEGTGSYFCERLIENVAAFNFTYIISDGTTTTTPSDPKDVRSVLIRMTIQKPAGRADPVSREYSTRIRCRNIGI